MFFILGQLTNFISSHNLKIVNDNEVYTNHSNNNSSINNYKKNQLLFLQKKFY